MADLDRRSLTKDPSLISNIRVKASPLRNMSR